MRSPWAILAALALLLAAFYAAGFSAGASSVTFVADVSLEEVQSCTDCIVSFRNQGGFSIVMPGFSGKLQVKGVVEIQVK